MTKAQVSDLGLVVELRGFEPLTFSLRTRRATNCATAPCVDVPTRGEKIPPGQRPSESGGPTRRPAAGAARPVPAPRPAASARPSLAPVRLARRARGVARLGAARAPGAGLAEVDGADRTAGGGGLGDVRRQGDRQRVPQRSPSTIGGHRRSVVGRGGRPRRSPGRCAPRSTSAGRSARGVAAADGPRRPRRRATRRVGADRPTCGPCTRHSTRQTHDETGGHGLPDPARRRARKASVATTALASSRTPSTLRRRRAAARRPSARGRARSWRRGCGAAAASA